MTNNSRLSFGARATLKALLGSFAALCLAQTDVLTYHNDNLRTGQNLSETILTTSKITSAGFGKLFTLPVDGKVDAQPLYVSGLAMPGVGPRNVVFVASEHDSVYAFDADSSVNYWHVTVLKAGETTSDNRGCGQVSPEIGVTSTPVIARNIGPHGTIYVVAMSKDASSNYHQRLHALDVTTGAEQFGGPVDIAATYPGTGDNSVGGTVTFDPKQYKSRPGLLLLNGIVYTSWSSHCDIRPYTGWVIGYNQLTLARTSIFNFAPNGNEASLWNAGAGPAADASGNIYFSVANGTFDTTLTPQGFPNKADYGNAFVKLALNNGTLTVADYWTMFDTVAQSNVDEDLGSGGVLLLPDVTDGNGVVRHLGVGAGKDRNIYIFDRDNMGKFNLANNSNLYQELPTPLASGEFAMPAWFNGTVYFGAVSDVIKAFKVSSALLSAAPTSSSAHAFPYPGTTPSISANGTTNGILWAVENSSPAVLHAYDANNLSTELYNSNQAAGRDQFGAGNKFITPMIAGGKVFVGTPNSVAVFGLLSQPPTAVSVSPINGSGANQTFSFTYSDPNGAADLQGMYFLFNNSLSASTACFGYYGRATNALYLFNDAGGLVAGSITPGSPGTLSNSQCTLGNAGVATTSGNNLTLPVAITFATSFAGSKNVYAYAIDNENAASGWLTMGTWTPSANQAPSVVSVSPINGTGTNQTFNITYSDPNGAADLNGMYFLFHSSLSGSAGCLGYYARASNAMYLFNDAGTGVVSGSIAPGTPGTLSNGQCMLSNAGAVTPSGTNLTLPVAITFATGFVGSKNVYAYAYDKENAASGWQTMGTWTPAPDQPPTVTSVLPINGSGAIQTFNAVYSDPDGAVDLNGLYLLFNSSLNASGGCLVYYVRPWNTMYLFNNGGTGLVSGSVTPGAAGTLSNSQCTIGNAGAVIVSGSNLTLPVAITFAGAFTGVKNVYAYAADSEGASSGWQTLGTWTPH